MDINSLLADRTASMRVSAIREILKLVNRPGMVSLAGGIPAPASFPMDIIPVLLERALQKYGSFALQYDLTEGFLPLREALVPYLAKKGITVGSDRICISSGSQGALDALGKVLVNPGDLVAVENPTYLGAMQAFNAYGPRYIGVETDEGGIIPEALETVLSQNRVKFVYLVPTFQNPTGRTLTLERRPRIAEILRRFDVLCIEDDPYSELRYRGDALPTLWSFAPERVVYLGTFSKIFAPGLRIGFYVAPTDLQNYMLRSKQGVDLHTSTLGQALAAEYLAGGFLDQQLPKILELYRPRQEAMLDAMDAFFPKGFTWSKPDGGMFIWVDGPQGLNTEELYKKAIEAQVAFVPGRFFYFRDDQGLHTMRLNFTMSSESVIRQAIECLGGVIRDFMK
jgi:2-aminoadipate transaminase